MCVDYIISHNLKKNQEKLRILYVEGMSTFVQLLLLRLAQRQRVGNLEEDATIHPSVKGRQKVT
jgi:hypothetical protein